MATHDDFQPRRRACGLVGVVDFRPSHDTFTVRQHSVDLCFWSRKHTNKTPRIRHRRGAKNGIGDKLRPSGIHLLSQRIRRIGMHRRAIDKKLPLTLRNRQGGGDGLVDGLIVGDAGEDDVCALDGVGDGSDGFRLALGEGGDELLGAGGGAVVDEEGGGVLAFFDEVFDHATAHVSEADPGDAWGGHFGRVGGRWGMGGRFV